MKIFHHALKVQDWPLAASVLILKTLEELEIGKDKKAQGRSAEQSQCADPEELEIGKDKKAQGRSAE